MRRFAFILFILSIAACNLGNKQEEQKNNETITPAYAVSDLVKNGYKGKIHKVITKEYPYVQNTPGHEPLPSAVYTETYNKDGFITSRTIESYDLSTRDLMTFIIDYHYKDNVLSDVVHRNVSRGSDTATNSKDDFNRSTPFSYNTVTSFFREGTYDTTDNYKTEFFLDSNYRLAKEIGYFHDNVRIRTMETHSYDTTGNADTTKRDGNNTLTLAIEQRNEHGNPLSAKRYSSGGAVMSIAYYYEYYQ